MKFSERLGYAPVKTQLQIEEINYELKNVLWSFFLEYFLDKLSNLNIEGCDDLGDYARNLWVNFHKRPIDEAPVKYTDGSYIADKSYLKVWLKSFMLENKNWYDPYDIIQFSAKYADADFIPTINKVLEREKSGYRFINGEICPIVSKVEIDEIEQALSSTTTIESVHSHLNASLKYISEKKNPIYRNSVKESISAVEAICKIYTKSEKSTLGDALTKLEKEGNIHPALKSAFSSLYGYTSSSAGIRHSLIENDRPVDFHEAKFMLVTCTSFINYLLGRMT